MVGDFIQFFTKRGGRILDPMCGTGSTLVAAIETGRQAVGCEIQEKWAQVAQDRVGDAATVVVADAGELPAIAEDRGWAPFDFLLTSPPYWDMLHHSRGNVFTSAKTRASQGLPSTYSELEADLGNETEYERFLPRLIRVYQGCQSLLKPDAYLVIICQNMRVKSGEVVPFSFDLTRAMIAAGFSFQGEKIWCQDNKKLGIWGYPSIFIPNYHHHYCLIFRNGKSSN